MLDRPATARAELLRRYHEKLSPLYRGYELRAESKAFQAEHRITADDPLMSAIQEIFGAHDRRAGGLSCPADCDEEVRKVIA